MDYLQRGRRSIGITLGGYGRYVLVSKSLPLRDSALIFRFDCSKQWRERRSAKHLSHKLLDSDRFSHSMSSYMHDMRAHIVCHIMPFNNMELNSRPQNLGGRCVLVARVDSDCWSCWPLYSPRRGGQECLHVRKRPELPIHLVPASSSHSCPRKPKHTIK